MLHSCGSVKRFIPYFIEAGFDILNPVQPMAKDMDPAELKAEFGSEISFLGGVDVQQTMRGPVAGVRDEVKQRIEELAPDGGFILAPSHNFGDDVPLENILAFFETASEFGDYPIHELKITATREYMMQSKPFSIGIYEKALPEEFSWRDRFDTAKQAGYDFLEMSIDESDWRMDRLDWGPCKTEKTQAGS